MSYFKQALEQIAKMHESKAHDYTKSGEFENFEYSAKAVGISVLQAIDVMIATKEARIISLRGREAKNESIKDTYLDRAVYAIMAYAYILHAEDSPQREQLKAIQGMNPELGPAELRPSGTICLNCGHAKDSHYGYNPKGYTPNCTCCAAGAFLETRVR